MSNSEKRQSNAEKASANLTRMQQYLASVDAVPFRIVRGQREANISALCAGAGVDRQVYNTRPEIKALVASAVAAKGFGVPKQEHAAPGADVVPAWAKQRIKDLEEQLAIAKAEALDLRVRLRRMEHLERNVIETGMLPR